MEEMLSSSHRTRAVLAGVLCAAATLLCAGTAHATTYWVSPEGSDAAAGTSSAPFASIGKAVSLARAGDAVLVRPGRYEEQVSLHAKNSGITVRGMGATRPVVDGGGVRRYGFYNERANRVTIAGFEVSGQYEAGIYTLGEDDVIAENLVHHVGRSDVTTATGIRVVWGARAQVVRNTVHTVGPGGESMGIWLLQTRDATVDSNVIYLIRKEGVRDWMGLDNRISSNRVFLNWVGIAFNVSNGAVAENNYVYDNVEGFDAKHTAYKTVLDYWHTGPHWSRFVRNTVFRSSEAGAWIAQSGNPLDYLELRANIFDGGGYTYIRDASKIRGPHVTVDANAYAPRSPSGPRFYYKEGWSSAPGLAGWDAFVSSLKWETKGTVLDPKLRDPAAGDLDYAPSSPAEGRGRDLGQQLGARGLAPAPVRWTPYKMTPIASSSPGTWWTTKHLADTADGDQASYWLTSTDSNEFVTYDLGQPRAVDHVIVTLFSHFDVRNPRGYRFEASSDGTHWRTVLQGQNPDTEGSSYKYEFPRTSARYFRYTMVDTSCNSYAPRTKCGAYFVLSDITVGALTNTDEATPPVGTSPVVGVKPPARLPRLDISSRRGTLKRGRVSIRLICRSARVACRGTVRMRGSLRTRRGARAARVAVSAPRNVRVRAGRRVTVALRLNGTALRLLRKRGAHRLEVMLKTARLPVRGRTVTVTSRR
jgi:parallel beta-helix repeat protein